MIPEWPKFQNEFRSRVKFVLHSRDKIELPNLRCPRSRRFCARPDTHAPLSRLRMTRFAMIPGWNWPTLNSIRQTDVDTLMIRTRKYFLKGKLSCKGRDKSLFCCFLQNHSMWIHLVNLLRPICPWNRLLRTDDYCCLLTPKGQS